MLPNEVPWDYHPRSGVKAETNAESIFLGMIKLQGEESAVSHAESLGFDISRFYPAEPAVPITDSIAVEERLQSAPLDEIVPLFHRAQAAEPNRFRQMRFAINGIYSKACLDAHGLTEKEWFQQGGPYGMERPIFEMRDANGHRYRIWANSDFSGFEGCVWGLNFLVEILREHHRMHGPSDPVAVLPETPNTE